MCTAATHRLASDQAPPSNAAAVSSTYRPGLDIVRFAAAIWVMLSHAHAAEGGGQAVAVFFVLSGYLIGGQLFREKCNKGTIELSTFYFKRITRIWLPYYIVLALMLAIFIARGQNSGVDFYERTFGAVTYTYNLVNDVKGNVHPTWISFNQIWSLSIEEQFYLLAPLMILILPVQVLRPACVALAVVLLFYLPLYAGMVVGVVLGISLSSDWHHKLVRQRSWAYGFAATSVFLLLYVLCQFSLLDGRHWLTYLLAAAIIVAAEGIETTEKSHSWLRYLGIMTYSYYLIHGLPVYFFGALYRRVFSDTSVPVWLQVILGLLALPVSYFFVRLIEEPCLRQRARALKVESPWISRSPWIAWGLNGIGIVGLIVIAMRR